MTKIPNLDTLLNSEDTNRSIIELDNFIGELCDYGDDFNKLTDQQKLFYLNQNLEREINNGGFNQYFINSSGDNAHDTILSLKAIGADKTADILQKAIDQFPNKTVPKDRDKRTEIVEQIEEVANEVWNDLDQKFYQYEDNLNTLNIEYIKKHTDFF
jgi:Domain of unknown function (DUF4375)